MFQGNTISSAEKAQTAQPSVVKTSFLRSVGRTFRSHRLGDLLMHAGLIDQGQLGHALKAQKGTGEQLGKILVRQGAISAVQLYRKLAEQWCLKASAAGLTLIMQTVTPSTARADDGGAVRLASAFAPAAIKAGIAHPNLFGSTEIKSNDISAFTKWTGVMQRFETQMGSRTTSPRVQMWKAEITRLKDRSVREQMAGINNYVNAVSYIEDRVNYGKSDYWATPIEFFSKGGDCEDFAVAKYASLRALGYSNDQLRIAIVQDKIKNIPHALLIVYTEEGTFVMDNQDKNLKMVQDVARYKPVFSINGTNWWLHRQAAGV